MESNEELRLRSRQLVDWSRGKLLIVVDVTGAPTPAVVTVVLKTKSEQDWLCGEEGGLMILK